MNRSVKRSQKSSNLECSFFFLLRKFFLTTINYYNYKTPLLISGNNRQCHALAKEAVNANYRWKLANIPRQ